MKCKKGLHEHTGKGECPECRKPNVMRAIAKYQAKLREPPAIYRDLASKAWR